MYERHFGLARPPFRITPDPEFFFTGAKRGAVLEALVYAIARGEGMVKVVGEVGSGKTMLCRMLERELAADCELVYLANPRLPAEAVVHAVAGELGLPAGADQPRLAVLRALQEYLVARHAAGHRVVVFVEEAQAMPLETLEEIRLLSNLETTQAKLLQLVLFGQPELDDKLARHEIRQLRERITHGFCLEPLRRGQVQDYVNARLRASGHTGAPLFSAAALRTMEAASAGLLRRINILADKALLAAFADGATRVEARHVRRAVEDSEFGGAARPRLTWALAGTILVLVLLAGLAWRWESFPRPGSPAQSVAPAVLSSPKVDMPTAPAPAPPAPPVVTPRVAPDTGLVGLEHLRPAGLPPVDPEALRRRWARPESGVVD
ncbi:MAG: ExeA family protein [Gammaproteobacteria bacterium]